MKMTSDSTSHSGFAPAADGATDLSAFVEEVRAFLKAELPDELRALTRANVMPSRAQIEQWQRILAARGWGAPGWPTEFGGTGWSLMQQAIFYRECAMADAPRFDNLGLATIGPAIIRSGTRAQQQKFLPAILNFDDYWAQAFSEPGAGSDLASLTTSAKLEGDHFIVNGTKIWQSHAHWSQWCLMLVRTEKTDRRQDGISVLLIDMKLPGLTVRPIKFINGSVFHSELFFDNVRVPVDCLLGEAGDGWNIARSMLVQERLFLARVPECERDLSRLYDMCARPGPDGSTLGDQNWFQRRLAELSMRFDGYAAAWWAAVAAQERGEEVGLASSVLRLMGTAFLQDVNEQQFEAVADDGLGIDAAALLGEISDRPLDPQRAENVQLHYLRYRGITLGAGTAEVQRGIVARALLDQGEIPLQTMPADQRPFADAAKRFVEGTYHFDRRRRIVDGSGFDSAVWSDLAELGVFGALVEEARGGSQLGAPTLAAMAVEFGRGLVVEPWYWACALAAAAAPYVPEMAAGLCSGQQLVALAASRRGVRESPYALSVPATAFEAGWKVDVELSPIHVGGRPASIWVPVQLPDGEHAILSINEEAALARSRVFRSYNGRALTQLTLDQFSFDASDLLVRGAQADALRRMALDVATVCECAEVVGAMQRALELTIEHLRTRRQFGRPLVWRSIVE